MKVSVDIVTIQKDNSTLTEDRIISKSIGNITQKNGFDIVSYDEDSATGLDKVKTIIKIQDDSITMIRYNRGNTTMYFKENVSYYTKYPTEFGDFDLDILTKKLEIFKNITSLGYIIKIEYNLSIKGLFDGTNKVEIKIKPVLD